MEIDRAGKFDVDKAKAAGYPVQKYWSSLQHGEEYYGRGWTYLTPDMVTGTDREKGIKLTYCTDTRPYRVDCGECRRMQILFICEGMYGEKDKEAKAREYKHMTFYEAAELAKAAEVGEMWLTHYSPSLESHPEEYLKDVTGDFSGNYSGGKRWTVR